jgi:hypothetical protein
MPKKSMAGNCLCLNERFKPKEGITHFQCVPVEHGLGIRLQTTLLAASSRLGMNLRELSSDVQLATILSAASSSHGDDDDEDGTDELGYFYAEVPTVGNAIHRFLYTAKARAVENE